MNKNEELGFPFGAMKKITVCIDIDGTLRNNTSDKVIANEDIRSLCRILRKFKNVKLIAWSGSGELYARQCADKMHATHFFHGFASKTQHEEIKPDIAIDDIQDTAIGKINLIVGEK